MITLVTGGARSGKSTFAESLYGNDKDVVYIATAKVIDDEMKERVKHHQNSRPKQWRTYEGDYNLSKAIGNEKKYLLDCVTILTSNIMYDMSKDEEKISFELQKLIEDKVFFEVKELTDKIREKNYDIVIVTNEVGDSIVPSHPVSRAFRDIQGRVNQRIAAVADQVYLVCCGIPVKIK
ncbi:MULTISPECIES: bifunctional adenosylcobinamide kinase/adenosylcobinamide-phosphate guanylyltransferase [Clostridium]|uniref:Adenosylcobinamide kinase n=2 Tax=Clostridium TaxID=1485 RepID=A0A151AKP1_9CLOT|nr:MULTISPECIES: bifunctional adenosylcobinamide kinase/adenosylcobinamide-phosphate guanylyltransferase [Clostridium]KYH28155.1 bifunctional adenosylcobalamin biosynthesis protein CobU [Clostridium colicanis DSM 13634]PRR72699.1 Bifunctional adenosylcobalamin biosynthesis protein CobU [Clostridium thermopalmarium DSM 5974]PVZ20887.1 adenosylcobinamide kinase /adenosylcobinamide-phosphate guanylyltransferase [Clostridium thermopalmarium DSM 5974]